MRKEITEVDAAICVAWVIVFSRRQKKEITPDVVMSEMLPMTEKQFIQLHKRPIVFYFLDYQIKISKIELHHCIKITYTHSLSSCIIYGESISFIHTPYFHSIIYFNYTSFTTRLTQLVHSNNTFFFSWNCIEYSFILIIGCSTLQ